MGEVTEQEIIDIANNFLLSSPPGEFMEVVTDVRSLLPNETLINNSASRTFREYNTEQMVIVDSPGQKHKFLVTKYGEVADGDYLDPRSKQVVHYDHIRQQVTSQKPISSELDSGLEPLRSAVEKSFVDYVSQHYPNGAGTVYGKEGQIIACISSAKFNPSNFWNGRWRSTWTYKDGQLTGSFKVVVHYYEDGNVQLNSNFTTKLKVAAGGNPEATAKAVVETIQKAEASYQQSLDASYATMGDTTFKALRRALPITRTKVDWNKIKNYKLGGEKQ